MNVSDDAQEKEEDGLVTDLMQESQVKHDRGSTTIHNVASCFIWPTIL